MLRLLKKRVELVEGEGVAEKAGRLFDSGLNCTQAVLQACIGLDDPQLMKMAEAFGGGIGDSRCLCGAVTGGVMALGLKGKGKKAARLMEEFKARNRVTCCKSLSAPYPWLSKEHLANCRRITAETAAMVERLLK
ncbi:C-GCAxxG-C-C family protein [Trichloromonas sp.]|uniref:C-GCAxxG-C-C family protein n=1 Tax=Trichloromonas sp. TaxID=3069249 RepID=UPI003D8146E0